MNIIYQYWADLLMIELNNFQDILPMKHQLDRLKFLETFFKLECPEVYKALNRYWDYVHLEHGNKPETCDSKCSGECIHPGLSVRLMYVHTGRWVTKYPEFPSINYKDAQFFALKEALQIMEEHKSSFDIPKIVLVHGKWIS